MSPIRTVIWISICEAGAAIGFGLHFQSATLGTGVFFLLAWVYWVLQLQRIPLPSEDGLQVTTLAALPTPRTTAEHVQPTKRHLQTALEILFRSHREKDSLMIYSAMRQLEFLESLERLVTHEG